MNPARNLLIGSMIVMATSVLFARVDPFGDAGPPEAQKSIEGDPIRGKNLFQKRCTGCHAMTQDREGPRLQGVYGRISGSVAGFDYSPALKKAHIVWNGTSLDQWLTNPDTLVPGNNMEFHVANPDERRDLIKFLEHSSGK
jgi:cytochrome c